MRSVIKSSARSTPVAIFLSLVSCRRGVGCNVGPGLAVDFVGHSVSTGARH